MFTVHGNNSYLEEFASQFDGSFSLRKESTVWKSKFFSKEYSNVLKYWDAIIFPFGINGKLTVSGVLNIGTPKIINFPFGTNGKLIVLDIPILKHLRVCWSVFLFFIQESKLKATKNVSFFGQIAEKVGCAHTQ